MNDGQMEVGVIMQCVVVIVMDTLSLYFSNFTCGKY